MKVSEMEIKKILDDHAAWLKGEETGKRADFSTGNWRGVDLHGANLQNAFLSVTYSYDDERPVELCEEGVAYYSATRTDLRGANLSAADLQAADLRGADLSGAELGEVNLRGADMSPSLCEEAEKNMLQGLFSDYDSYKTDLTGADLSGADLRGANLRGANLTGANLTDANLRGVDLSSANLTDAILKDANLSGANLEKATLTNVDLTGAKLQGVKGYPVAEDNA